METVFIAFGSNIGDRQSYITTAIETLRNLPGVIVDKVSSTIETKPCDGPPQGDYLNGVLKVRTELEPQKLLLALQAIEREMGRVRNEENGPRTLDLDILLYGDRIIKQPNLVVPHPRMWEREFVMKPLLEIEPNIKKDDYYR